MELSASEGCGCDIHPTEDWTILPRYGHLKAWLRHVHDSSTSTSYLKAFEADGAEIELGGVAQRLSVKTANRQRFHAHVAVVLHRRLEEESVEQREVMVDRHLGRTDDTVDARSTQRAQRNENVSSQPVLVKAVAKKTAIITVLHPYTSPVRRLSRRRGLKHTHTHTHTRLTALFRDYPGDPVPER